MDPLITQDESRESQNDGTEANARDKYSHGSRKNQGREREKGEHYFEQLEEGANQICHVSGFNEPLSLHHADKVNEYSISRPSTHPTRFKNAHKYSCISSGGEQNESHARELLTNSNPSDDNYSKLKSLLTRPIRKKYNSCTDSRRMCRLDNSNASRSRSHSLKPIVSTSSSALSPLLLNRSISHTCVFTGTNEWRIAKVKQFEVWPRSDEEKRVFKYMIAVKVLFVLIIIVLMGFAITHKHLILILLESFMSKIELLGYWSPFLYYMMYTFIATLFFPAELLTVAAGFIFTQIFRYSIGFTVSMIVAISAQETCLAICFCIARYTLQKPLRLLCKRFVFYHALMTAVDQGGTTFIALLRLSPIIPFTLSNYCFGLTQIPLYTALIGSLSTLPINAALIWSGSLIGSLHNLNGNSNSNMRITRFVLIGFGAVFAVGAIGYIGWLTSRKIKDILTDPDILQRINAEDTDTFDHQNNCTHCRLSSTDKYLDTVDNV